MKATVRFGLLGPVRVWDDKGELDAGPPQQRAVLTYLLLNESRHVSVDDVVEALWGRHAPPSAIGVVRTYMSRLRRVFTAAEDASTDTEARIWSNRCGYRLLVHQESVDVTLFRARLSSAREARQRGDLVEASHQLRHGLALWRGPALSGLGMPQDTLVGSFFQGRRTWLEQLRTSAAEERLALDIELGDHDEAIAELAVVVTEHPYRERLWELLMWGLYRGGRQAEALATYRDIGHLLKGELGLEPGPELRKMHARILAADPSLMQGLYTAAESRRRPPSAPPGRPTPGGVHP
jgi:SARP family transcriptional regulator, regulator of embCAB operon